MSAPRPLDGVVVLELGQILAGPYAGQILAAFGAEVIKVEPPDGGDPIRGWRGLDPEDDTSLWWRSLGRDKQVVAIDLAAPRGQSLVRELARQCDVVIENFRPGTLEKWGLGPEVLCGDNPSLVLARVSGFGQTGPYSRRPGYASVCEAFGGLRHLTGQPGEVPVRSNLSLGDSLAGLQAALGVLLALRARDADPGRRGQVVDVAIFEAVFGMLESAVPELDRLGVVRGPSGTTITGIVPSNAYPCADGRHVVVGANNTANYRRLMRAIGRDDLADDPELATNPGRVERQAEIDAAVATWTSERPSAEAVARLEAVAVPASTIFSVADMMADPHYAARELFERLPVGGRDIAFSATGPKLSRTPARALGRTRAGRRHARGAGHAPRPRRRGDRRAGSPRRRRCRRRRGPSGMKRADRGRDALTAVLLVAGAFALRWPRLGERTFGHPENFVSGIPVPHWAGPLARRIDWETMVRGTIADGHPPLYFALMLGWTDLFGHSLVALRLPSAIVGALSAGLLYALGRRVAGRSAALLAAVLLALAGLHVYWSQIARMYLLASFFVLLATLWLVRLEEEDGVLLRAGYGTAVAAALWTQLYAWPAIFVHCLWTGWKALRTRSWPAAMTPLLTALTASMPIVALQIHQYGPKRHGGFFDEPQLGFFALGHAFSDALPFWSAPPAPPVPLWLLGGISVGLAAVAMARSPELAPASADDRKTRRRPSLVGLAILAAMAVVSARAIVDFALARGRNPVREWLLATAVATVAIALAGIVAGVVVRRRAAPAGAEERVATDPLRLVALLAVVPLALMEMVSLVRPALVERGTVVYVPYLLLLVAAGAVRLGGHRAWRALAAAALIALSVASYRHSARAEGSRYDYAGLARELLPRLGPRDVVLVGTGFQDLPLLYYFEGHYDRIAGRKGLRRALRRRPPHVWVVAWGSRERPSPRLRRSLAAYRATGETVRAHRAWAARYERVVGADARAARRLTRQR